MKRPIFILLPTIGHPNLINQVKRIADQMEDCDRLLIVFDEIVQNFDLEKTKSKGQITVLYQIPGLGHFGHAIRNKFQSIFGTSGHLWHVDDDDLIREDAIYTIRKHLKEKDKMYVFKMQWFEKTMPNISNPEKGNANHIPEWLTPGNIGTPCGLIPLSDLTKLPTWQYKYGGDFDFYQNAFKNFDWEFVNEIIYNVKEK